MKKLMMVVLAVVMTAALFAGVDEAVKNLFSTEVVKPQVITLTDAQALKIQTALGIKMAVRKEYTIYAGKTTVVVIEEQQGKWGLIKMAIAIDKAAKKVTNIEIYAMQEKRGAGIKTVNFLGQFTGKTIADGLEMGKDVRGISGATVSSKAVAIAVKRALQVYNEAGASIK